MIGNGIALGNHCCDITMAGCLRNFTQNSVLAKPNLKSVETEALSEEQTLRRAIKHAIVCQKLTPSQKITEHVISDMYDTTRTMARSLIEKLIAQNFLVSISPRITRVAPLTVLSIKENFLLRKMLAPDLVAMSSPHIDLNVLASLNQEMTETRVDTNDSEQVLQLVRKNRDYNTFTIVNMKYPLLASWIELLEDMAMRIYWLYVKLHGQLPFNPTTQLKLFDAIKQDDADTARAVVWEILDQNEDRILHSIFADDRFSSKDLIL